MKGDLAGALEQAVHEEGAIAEAVSWPRVVARMFVIAKTDPCFVKAGADEPLFVLRAKDETAPWLVNLWADNLDNNYGSSDAASPQSVKALEAYEQADRMRSWQKEHGSKVPD